MRRAGFAVRIAATPDNEAMLQLTAEA
jgi:hypothetical protein